MKTKLLFIVLLAMITFSCRTVKQTTTSKAEVKTEANLNVKQSNESNLSTETNLSTVDKSVTNEDVSVKVTETVLSKPDSSGKQFAEKITVTEQVKNTNKVANVNTESNVKTNDVSKTKLADKSDFKSDSIANNINTQETKTKTPGWITICVIVLIFSGLGLIYYLLKKYNVLK